VICEMISLPERDVSQLQNFSVSKIVPFGMPELEIEMQAMSTFMDSDKGQHNLSYPDINTMS